MFNNIRKLVALAFVLVLAGFNVACTSTTGSVGRHSVNASLSAGQTGTLTCYDNDITAFGEIKVKVLSAREAGQTGSCDGYELPASSITKKAVEDGGFVVYRHGKAYFNPFTEENGVFVVNPWSKRDLSAA